MSAQHLLSAKNKDKPLNSLEIEKFLRKECKYFHGIFASNDIPKFVAAKEKFTLICNLSPNTSKGTHWITIIGKPEFILYLDSFGLPPLNMDIKQFLKTCNRPTYWNKKNLQFEESNACGYYCILFCLHFEMEKSTIKFSENLIQNDMNCIKYIREIINNK